MVHSYIIGHSYIMKIGHFRRGYRFPSKKVREHPLNFESGASFPQSPTPVGDVHAHKACKISAQSEIAIRRPFQKFI